METISDIKNNFLNFINEFDNMINDSFGIRLKENELNEFLKNIEMLDIYEKEIEIQINQIKILLLEAKAIVPMGF